MKTYLTFAASLVIGYALVSFSAAHTTEAANAPIDSLRIVSDYPAPITDIYEQDGFVHIISANEDVEIPADEPGLYEFDIEGSHFALGFTVNWKTGKRYFTVAKNVLELRIVE